MVPESWLYHFEPWSLQHIVTLAACALAMAAAVMLGRSWRRSAPLQERALRIGWSVFVLVFQAMAQRWWFLPEHFVPRDSLPLHICDMVIWFTPFALMWQRRLAMALMYFWGVGLSVAAFFNPVLFEGSAQTKFWLYWVGHTQIVGTGIYVVAVMGFWPSLADLWRALGALLVYTAVLIPLDYVMDFDYGYLGPDSDVVDMLGKWPARIILLLLLETSAFIILWLPFACASRLRTAAMENRPAEAMPAVDEAIRARG
jgi:hypothetical integral membrane protein (TIGR02206 family)